MNTPEEIIAVVQAHIAGKKIECHLIGTDLLWQECIPKYWDFHHWEYRIAPESPRVVKLCAWVCKKSGEVKYRKHDWGSDGDYWFRAPELDKEITLPDGVEW